jgi:hypothetical protein
MGFRLGHVPRLQATTRFGNTLSFLVPSTRLAFPDVGGFRADYFGWLRLTSVGFARIV